MLKETILLLAAVVLLASATHVRKCNNGDEYEDPNEVEISNCNEAPCKLKRKTRVTISQKFTPERDIQSLTTSVFAQVAGVPLPFIGVDGTDACGNISNVDGTKAACPLKKGVKYIYTNTFPILPFYPLFSLTVHYALVEGNDVVTCFEVASKITN